MGSDEFYPDERPVHERTVGDFRIDRYEVTNADFARFVEDTGYVTVAERPLDPAAYPGVAVEDLVPGALVFTATAGPVDLDDWRQWWRWQPGAQWRSPAGPGSTVEDRMRHPVVQVSYEDAAAYASWAGKRLPTETEHEFAARGGRDGQRFAWGDAAYPGGRPQANSWIGRFPYDNRGRFGASTAPVGSFPANGYGLFDMIGNVWEWTTTRFEGHHRIGPAQGAGGPKPCCTPSRPDPSVSQVLKGGSHLCAPEYCRRYRPTARSPQAQDSATTHIGFRCAADLT